MSPTILSKETLNPRRKGLISPLNSRVVLKLKGFSESIVGEIIIKSPYIYIYIYAYIYIYTHYMYIPPGVDVHDLEGLAPEGPELAVRRRHAVLAEYYTII